MANVGLDNSLYRQPEPPKEEQKSVISGAAQTGVPQKKWNKLVKKVFVTSGKEVASSFGKDLLDSMKIIGLNALSKWLTGETYAYTGRSVSGNLQRSIAHTINLGQQVIKSQPSVAQQINQQRSPIANNFSTYFSYDSNDDAIAVLDVICAQAEKYHKVRVPDLYEVSGLSSDPQWQNWGWYEDEVLRVRPKYNTDDKRWYIIMPQAHPINN